MSWVVAAKLIYLSRRGTYHLYVAQLLLIPAAAERQLVTDAIAIVPALQHTTPEQPGPSNGESTAAAADTILYELPQHMRTGEASLWSCKMRGTSTREIVCRTAQVCTAK
jgi:hypothetical protein